MSLESDLITVTAKLNADADAITMLMGGSGGTPGGSQTFTLPSGYAIAISENGLDKLSLGGVIIGNGIVQLIDGSWFYRPFDQAGFTPQVTSKSVSHQPNGAVVTHTYTGLLNAKVVYTYTVSGNDIHVSTHVTNNHATKPLQPAFQSMRFLRGTGGTYINLGDQSQTQNNGEGFSYPSVNIPYAASVLSGVPSTAGPQINLATWSGEDPNEKFMSMLFSIYPHPGVSVGSVFFNRVPPGGSRIYKYAYRFQNSTDWKDLLGGYKAALRAALPTLAYEPDARPLAQFASIHPTYIRPDNPYGYNDGGSSANCVPGKLCRRFDLLAGCENFVSQLVGPMTQTGYQGVVLWNPQGIHPRGVRYRPDFNSFPAVTIPNLPTLASGFRNAGLNIGLLARPSIAITSANDWDHDTAIEVTDAPGTRADINLRFDWASSLGFNAYYLDSFIHSKEDHDLLKAMRTKVGPNVHFFVEHSTALSMALGASYEQLGNWSNGLVLTQRQQILRWLWPESIVAAKYTGALPPGGYATLYQAMFDLKLTPWIEDYRAQVAPAPGNENGILQPLVASRIGPNKRWL